MERREFQKYCNKISCLIAEIPDWQNRPSSIVEDYLRTRALYGFERALVDLLQISYTVIEDKRLQSKKEFDLYELSEAVFSQYTSPTKYKFVAFYFVVSVLAVCLNKAILDDVDVESFDSNEFVGFDFIENIENETDPQKRKLNKFANRLRDFSRSNQLVDFKQSKNSAIMLYSSDMADTIRILQNNKKIYICDWADIGVKVIVKCKICGRQKNVTYDAALKRQNAISCEICDAQYGHNRKSMIPLKERFSFVANDYFECPNCLQQFSVPQLLEGDFECHNCGQIFQPKSYPIVGRSQLKSLKKDEVISGIGDAEVNSVITTLINRAANLEKNFGMHVLYLACGFLEWKDRNGTEYASPLLLCPVDLHIDRSIGSIYFQRQNGDAEFKLNKTLVYMLSEYSQDCAIALPEYDGKGDIRVYFAEIKNSLKGHGQRISRITQNWKVVSNFGIGFFRYQKLELYNELKNNIAVYLSNSIIRRLCGDESCDIARVKQKSDSLNYMVLDADSSQEEVIKASQEGKSFVLQGPPGSGKSQTITNIITVALGDGKNVLFVTEKAAARSIIFENLKRCTVDETHSLTDFVIDFENISKRGGIIGRKPFVDELNKCLQRYSALDGCNDQLIEMNKYFKSQIERFMIEMQLEVDGKCYMQLLQDAAKYVGYQDLTTKGAISSDPIKFTRLYDCLEKYYLTVDDKNVCFDYRKDCLYNCKGDSSGQLLDIARKYIACIAVIECILNKLQSYGWKIITTKSHINYYLKLLTLWTKMPVVTFDVSDGINIEKINKLIAITEQRITFAHKLRNHKGKKLGAEIKLASCDFDLIDQLFDESNEYKSRLRRCGKRYKNFKNSIFGYFKKINGRRTFANCLACLQKLRCYREYCTLKRQYEDSCSLDVSIFGVSLSSIEEWREMKARLVQCRDVIAKADKTVVDICASAQWLKLFTSFEYNNTIRTLNDLVAKFSKELKNEELLGNTLALFVDGNIITGESFDYKIIAQNIINGGDRIAKWGSVYELLAIFDGEGWLCILNELVDKNIYPFSEAKKVILHAYYSNLSYEFARNNQLTTIYNFDKHGHEKLMQNYAMIDQETLNGGAKRLYSHLSGELHKDAKHIGGSATVLHKIASRTGYSIKQTITENWEYIKKIKPCFMMSPLNVSQYIDVGLSFDLVIFDEASQIFTEDALASLVRGKQVIIAGDSKQLPPCDFFRSNDNDFESYGYRGVEANWENSLLTAADETMNEASIQLRWHYRSCDEALIAFSNKYMEYNLISFPSAAKKANDGVRYVSVPYNSQTCYDAGKNGTHINIGEAEKVIWLIWEEITDVECKNFSIGVVAFSNAQAQEIEKRWELFKNCPDRKNIIEEWEKTHKQEPLIFRNLDTMQGDERDIMILSICYSPDKDGKFKLSYLGSIRLEAGKKRINVAITRSRHQMIVVSTLTDDLLNFTIENSSATEENKTGVMMLCDFLKYAKSLVLDKKIVMQKSYSHIVQSICELLKKNRICYETDIGRSDCKIDVGIKKFQEAEDFILGIIVDDPRRPDFNNPREYSRLTESILINKYSWKLYRIFPISWLNNYNDESRLLLIAINDQLKSAG